MNSHPYQPAHLNFLPNSIGRYREKQKYWYCWKCGVRNLKKTKFCKKCGEKLLINLTVEPINIAERAEEENLKEHLYGKSEKKDKTQQSLPKAIIKLFLHGFLFVILYLALGFTWVFMLVVLVSIGWLIGLAIAFGILFLGIGFINTILGVHLWDIRVNTEYLSVFLHGIVVFIIGAIINVITSILPNYLFPGTFTYITTLIISCFLFGMIGRQIASWFSIT